MKVLVIGASRGIGKACVTAAVAAGHEVRAMARNVDTVPEAAGVERFAGDATQAEDVARALEGVDAVILALGIRESIAMLWQPVTLFSEATALLIPAMQDAGIRRLVCITGIGAGESVSAFSAIERLGHRMVLGQPYKDKTVQEGMIRASDLDWTLLRPVILTNGAATGTYRVLHDPSEWRLGLISRADVADCAVKALSDESFIGAAPVLTR
ncbi:MAG: SDR family oxidoreductase [Paracoccaceae bacterium]|nr:SDR family oxidoreductase [Paracoccaceae bacterium]